MSFEHHLGQTCSSSPTCCYFKSEKSVKDKQTKEWSICMSHARINVHVKPVCKCVCACVCVSLCQLAVFCFMLLYVFLHKIKKKKKSLDCTYLFMWVAWTEEDCLNEGADGNAQRYIVYAELTSTHPIIRQLLSYHIRLPQAFWAFAQLSVFPSYFLICLCQLIASYTFIFQFITATKLSCY